MGARVFSYDNDTLLSDAGAITASAAALVSSVAKILDVGAARLDGVVVVDVSAIDISSTDERYQLIIQGSNSSSFASGIENLATLDLGATASRGGGAQNSTVGRYEIHVTNEQNDTVYRYMRLYRLLSGTTPSINSTAFLTPYGC